MRTALPLPVYLHLLLRGIKLQKLDGVRRMKVLCVTSNPCIDEIIWYRDSDRKPVRVRRYFGGKGVNVARMLKGAGVEVCSLTITGTNHELIRHLCDREAFPSVLVPTSMPIRTMPLYINLKDRSIFQEYHSGNRATPEECEHFLEEYERLLEERPQWVVISGAAAEGMEDVFPELIRMARDKGCLVFFDSYGSAFQKGLPYGPDYVKPNMEELTQAVGAVRQGQETKAAERLREAGAKNVFVTLGEGGSCLVTEEGVYRHPGFRVRTVSAVGSGDSFTAFYVYGMIYYLGIEKSFAMANAAGAVNARHVLSGQVTLKSVQKLLESGSRKVK